MTRSIHFDLTVDDLERAMKFYKDVFGCKFEEWDGPMENWMATSGTKKEPGITSWVVNEEQERHAKHEYDRRGLGR